jgi:hypothetical protein
VCRGVLADSNVFAVRDEQNGALHVDQRNTPTIERQSQFLIAQGEAKVWEMGVKRLSITKSLQQERGASATPKATLVPQRAKLG